MKANTALSDELTLAKRDLAFEINEKGKRAAELVIANIELTFQNEEKEKRAAELTIVNRKLAFQIAEREKLAAELIIANDALAFQNEEKKKRAADLILANQELVYENGEKEKRAAELVVANHELTFQNNEKEKRAAELIVANRELTFQNEEKEKRALELVLANKELLFQNGEKEKRAAELVIANGELAFQNEEKEKRALELVLANQELLFQNGEKEKRAAELVIANKELAFQNEEKEKRAAELITLNAELKAFSYVSSHDLQEPLRKIQLLSDRILGMENQSLSEKGKDHMHRILSAATRMRTLIDDLLAFSSLNIAERKFEIVDLNIIIDEVKDELKETIDEKHLTIEALKLCKVRMIPFQFCQVIHNLINNSLRFSKPGVAPSIVIESRIAKGRALGEEKLQPEASYCHISFSDNGIGFDPEYKDRIFEVFKRLHGREAYAGSGIGLAIVKKIMDNHNGIITATGSPDRGATFNIYLPYESDAESVG
ncbi:MAG TPA: ATP-binding protein [Chryseolinea sp.]